MTPKEKAEELVNKYITNQNFWYLKNLVDGLRISQAKQCALIAVDEILNGSRLFYIEEYKYWQEVKQEIEKS
jgi:hypothetical protein